MKEVADDFEKYAAEHYLPALDATEADEQMLLAALRYVGTRKIPGHRARLVEILTTRLPRKIKREIDAACVDGLIATGQDPLVTGRILVLAATEPRPLAGTKLCEEGLARLGPPANEALLHELTKPHQTARLRKLAALLTRTSRVRSPDPVAAWIGGDANQRLSAVDRWRDRIAKAGRLPPPPSAPVEPTSAPAHPNENAPQ